jgi:DNA-binding response OmpR family regulator
LPSSYYAKLESLYYHSIEPEEEKKVPTESTGIVGSEIVLIESNYDVYQYIVEILRDGYRIWSTADGQAAIEYITEKSPIVVLIDMNVGVKAVVRLCNMLKSDEKKKNIPIILLHTKTSDDITQDFRSPLIDEYLGKPFSPMELKTRILSTQRWSEVKT